ncbi:phosphopyruvate hydratase [Nonomuraea roseoviolacea subsp. roseoviolacea]|uniref:hypothetical protein n=1 Tax=Nonomuraea roseoviolacea TaxID=103837 RepID=UPI0031DD1C8C
MSAVTGLRLRGILDSRGRPTVEADVRAGDAWGRGSCPVAIAPGRLERRRGLRTGELGDLGDGPVVRLLRDGLTGVPLTGQGDLDRRLRELDDRHGLGADVTLAVSLAHARALAAGSGVSLRGWMSGLFPHPPRMPRLLVNAFSGGIHHDGAPDSFQQIMAVPDTGTLTGDVRAALEIYGALERRLSDAGPSGADGRRRSGGGAVAISASSGLLAPGWSCARRLEELRAACEGHRAGLGADVAAEHLLAGPGRYRYEGREHASAAFAALLLDLAVTHGIAYLEDPFDPADTGTWRAFLPAAREAGVTVVGDDLFASDAGRVVPGLADAVLLKPSQAGTVTATLEAAAAARALGLRLVVSHRSGETEDTAMCDLAVAVGAEWIKIGGPRRGDRIAKYNQLIRLAETLTDDPVQEATDPVQETTHEGAAACHAPSSSRT